MSQTPIQTAYLMQLDDDGRRFWLQDDRIFIGRSVDNHIVISNKYVARHHALIQQEGPTYWLEDLRSPHGTKLNGESVVDRAELADGDLITIGDVTFVFWREAEMLDAMPEDKPDEVETAESPGSQRGQSGKLDRIKTDGWNDEPTPSAHRHEPDSIMGIDAAPADEPHSGTGEIAAVVAAASDEDSEPGEPHVSSRASDAELMNTALPATYFDTHKRPTRKNNPTRSGAPVDNYPMPAMGWSPQIVQARLLAVAGPVDGHIYEVGLEGASIGRTSDNSIYILDENLSRHQARIMYENQGYWLIDLESANGTFVNGHRLYEPYRLRSGDQIVMGHSRFLVTLQME